MKQNKQAEIISLDDALRNTYKNVKKGGDGLSQKVNNNDTDSVYPIAPELLNKKAKKHWDSIHAAYESCANNDFLSRLENYALARYCNWLVHYEKAEKNVSENGATQKTESGYEAVTGSFTVLERVDAKLSKLEKQLGFAPGARKAILTGNPSQGDLFEELAGL